MAVRVGDKRPDNRIFLFGIGFYAAGKRKREQFLKPFDCRFIKTDTRFYPSGSERVLQKSFSDKFVYRQSYRVQRIQMPVFKYAAYRYRCGSKRTGFA